VLWVSCQKEVRRYLTPLPAEVATRKRQLHVLMRARRSSLDQQLLSRDFDANKTVGPHTSYRYSNSQRSEPA
jgi:hypothetical protein